MLAQAFKYRSKDTDSSDSDSSGSDDECNDWKRASRKKEMMDLEKIPIVPLAQQETAKPEPVNNSAPQKRKRNNVWCEVIQDQMISETLDNCGIKRKPAGYGSRGAESYDYTLKYSINKENGDGDKKSSEDEEMSDGESAKSSNDKTFKGQFNPKYVELDSAGADAARKIVKILQEEKKYLIFRTVKYLGIEKAMKLLKMTEEIEENGGMMIKNNVRRRTPGGVFLSLIKSDKDIEKTLMDKIFEGEMNSYERKTKFAKIKKDKKEKRNRLKKEKEKLEAEKQALLDEFAKELQPVLPPKEEDATNSVEMEEAEVVNNITDVVNSKLSDLEDGELDD